LIEGDVPDAAFGSEAIGAPVLFPCPYNLHRPSRTYCAMWPSAQSYRHRSTPHGPVSVINGLLPFAAFEQGRGVPGPPSSVVSNCGDMRDEFPAHWIGVAGYAGATRLETNPVSQPKEEPSELRRRSLLAPDETQEVRGGFLLLSVTRRSCRPRGIVATARHTSADSYHPRRRPSLFSPPGAPSAGCSERRNSRVPSGDVHPSFRRREAAVEVTPRHHA
jgi:hypothetical protein